MTNQTNVKQLFTDNLDIWLSAENEKKSGRGRSSNGSNKNNVYGVQKLRELILELAVRGKLVPKSSSWKELKLGEIGKWAIGSGFPTEEQGRQNEDVLFAKVSDMNLPQNEKFIVETNNKISYETAKRLRINIHFAGTVIFPKIGGAIATNKRRVLTRDTAIDNNCLGLVPTEGVSTDWLFLQLLSMDLTKYQAGTSVPALSQGVLQEIPVLLPNPNEQHRIVAKVDELMALCDQLEQQHSNAQQAHETLVNILLSTLTQSQNASEFQNNWQRIAAHFDTLFTTQASIDTLKQTLLQLAVMGKLVPQDPNDEPASELLKRIQAEKAQLIAEGKLKKEKPLAPISEDEKPFALPKGWEWVRLISLSELITSGSRDWAQYLAPIGAKFVTMGNLSKGSYELRLDNMRYVIPPPNGEGSRTKLEQDDILVSITGDVGNLGRIPKNFGEAYINQHTALVRLLPLCRNKFFPEVFRSPLASKQFNEPQRGVKNSFRLTDLEELLLPLAPFAEQHRIVVKVDELMALCDQLNTCIQQASQQQQVIADALVAQAVI